MKGLFAKLRISNEDFSYVADKINENNRKSVAFLCAAGIALFSVLIVLSFFDIVVAVNGVFVYALALALAIGVLLFVKIGPKTSTATMLVSYFTMGAVLSYGLIISYLAPDEYTVTFIAILCILSMTFVDKPIRLGIAHILVTLISIGMVCVHKSENVLIADLINISSFSALSFIGGLITVNAKMHGYIMDKRQEEDIERGKRRINAIEMEALQLLTAVRSTHDMIVSVNLTKNTYKLIGAESFVTQGDALEGNFDEVINVHAAKVVEEHRQLYRDTFSREGLLSAYAAGKRKVYLEYQQCDDEGVPHWLGTHTMFLVDPHGTDITEITISQNIDERVRKEAETKEVLEAERDRAELAKKAKTDFLFQMSHDIRTPMNAIIGFTNFIKASNDIDAIHDDYVVKLETAGHQLLMLINDALEMSRIESGKLEFHRELQDIRSIVANVMSVMQMQAEEKGVTLISDFVVTHPTVFCDQNHMSRVIMNLLSNAVKFTPSGGRVSVSLREQESASEGRTAFELKIADTGIGMSPAFLERVFEPFEREQSSTVSGVQGTGLGLAIVKRIVETAGDRISVQSKLGEGTTFTLQLSLYRGEERTEGICEIEEAPLQEQMQSRFQGKRILLVEDNEFNLTIAQVLLENAGFIVETATDGRVAVDKVVNAPDPHYYDVILMDVQMPIMNGYDATREIRALEDERGRTPIIALTANAFDTDKENAFAAGMDGHIAKPIDVATLYRALWGLLRKGE